MNGFEPKQFGKYYLVEKIAVGGMAEIYKAKTFGVDGFEKLLAIKRVLPHCAADKDFITMLIDEAKLSVLLSHANIVQVYDLGKIGEDYFISMEYIHGVNLRDVMYHCRETQMPISPEIAVYIIAEVCKGLDYAHRKADSQGQPLNIVHRDVSPQNILLSYEGEVKIVDFGIAKAAMNISHTMAGILKGKIAYMSPEQALGKTIDYRTDIFSAGILLYEMLTNSKLYTGESQFEVLKKIRTTRIDETKLPGTIPETLKWVVAKALAYKSDDRFQNAGDLQIELTKFLYSTYLDFSPRKLAAFIKDLFSTELKEEQMKRAREAALESQTASMSVAEGAKQLEIVHREISLTPIEERPPEAHIETMVTPLGEAVEKEVTTERKRVMRKKASRWPRFIAATAILAAVIYGVYRYIPAIRIGEQKPAPEIPAAAVGALNVISEPSGASIIFDGKTTGQVTPATIEDIKLGVDHRVALSKPEYEDFEQTINLTNTKPQKLSAVMKAIPPPPLPEPILPPPVTPLPPVTPPPTTSPPAVATPQPPPPTTPAPPTAPPEAPPVKAEEFGSLQITSNPSGAKIIIDGKATGKQTPATIGNLKVGKSYTVGLQKTEFERWSKKITVASAKPVNVSGDLKQKPPEEVKPPPPTEAPPAAVEKGAPAQIRIASNPSGAEVFVNAEYKGKTPLTASVQPGTVSIIVNKEGLARYSKKITVRPGEKVNLTDINLSDLYGEVSLSSVPARATVTFDGQTIPAKTPVTIRKVRRDQPHSVSISLPGYRTWSTSVNMEGGDKTFNVVLEPQ